MEKRNLNIVALFATLFVIALVFGSFGSLVSAAPPKPTTPTPKIITAQLFEYKSSESLNYAQQGPIWLQADSGIGSASWLTPTTVTIQGGGVSGGVAWENSVFNNGIITVQSSGGAPAAGFVSYTTGSDQFAKQLALPITNPVTIPECRSLAVMTRVPIPRLWHTPQCDPETATCKVSGYSATAIASIVYVEG